MVSNKIKRIMKLKNVSSVQLAQHMGIVPQSLSNKFSRDSWSVQDLISVLDFLGCKLVVELEPDLIVKFSLDDIRKKE